MEKVFKEYSEFLDEIYVLTKDILEVNQEKFVDKVMALIEANLIVGKKEEFHNRKPQIKSMIEVKYINSKILMQNGLKDKSSKYLAEFLKSKDVKELADKVAETKIGIINYVKSLDPSYNGESISPFYQIENNIYNYISGHCDDIIEKAILKGILSSESYKTCINNKEEIELQVKIRFDSSLDDVEKSNDDNKKSLSTNIFNLNNNETIVSDSNGLPTDIFNTNESTLEKGGPTLTLKGPGVGYAPISEIFNDTNINELPIKYQDELPIAGVFR